MEQPNPTMTEAQRQEVETLRAELALAESKLAEAQEVIRAIQSGEVDALVVSGPKGEQVFTLRGAEYGYRVLVEAMNEGAATLAADGTVLYCNQCLSNLLKTPLEKIIGNPVAKLFAPEWATSIAGLLARALSGEAIKSELELQVPKGRRIPVFVSLCEMKDDERTSVCMVVTDSTERKLMELELTDRKEHLQLLVDERAAQLQGANSALLKEILEHRRTEERTRRLAAIVESSDDAIYSKTLDGIILTWNQGAERLYGYSAAEAIGQSMMRLVPVERENELKDFLQLVARGERVESHETVRMRKDGSRVEVSVALSAVKDIRGKVIGASAIARDITERKQAEEKLIRYELMASRTRDIVLFIRYDDGRILEANEAAINAYGYPREELESMTIHQLREPATRALAPVEMAIAEMQGTLFESVHQRADGSVFPVEVSSRGANIAGVRTLISIVRDITERKQAEDKLHKLNRALKATSNCDHALLHAETEEALLESVCKIITQDCGHALVWIGFAEDDEDKTIRPVAHAGFEKGYLQTLQLTWADTERGRGPTGVAIRTCQPSACMNIFTDAKFEPWRTNAIKRGYVSSLGLPLIQDGKAFGAVTIYSREPDRFPDDEIKLLAELTADLAYGIGTLRVRAARKRAEEARRESETAFEALTNLVPQFIWICSPDGLSIYFNQRWVDYTGLTLEESYGRGWNTPFHPDDKQAAWDAWNRATQTGEQYRIGSRLRAADGSYRRFLMLGEPLKDSEGNISRWFGTCTDIEDMKQAEAALRESEAQFRTLANAIPQLSWMANADGWIFWYNQRWYEYTGTTPQQMEGWGWKSVHDPEALPKVLERWTGSITSGEPFDMVFPLRGADGVFRPFLTRVMPVRDQNGKITGWFGTNTDISAQVRAEEALTQLNVTLDRRVGERTAQLEASNKELESFAYSVSHDLRAPLRGIDGWSLALAEDYADSLDEKAHKYLDRVRSETQRMGLLIDDLLQLSRITRTELGLSTVDLTSIAQGIAARLCESRADRRIEFIIAPELTDTGDARLLEIALTNLLDNAVKFTGPNALARIEVGQTECDGERPFYVRDNGVGFDMPFASKLFGAFQRLHKTSEFPGTGIGLATVQRIIHRHGGRIWAESKSGQGATFYFTIGAS